MKVGLFYLGKARKVERSSPVRVFTTTPVRGFTTTNDKLDIPVIHIIDADGSEIKMGRTDAVVTYLALGVALKTTEDS